MSAASNSEHLSMMTNDWNIDNKHHNNPWCMWTIMLYYYIGSLGNFICYAINLSKDDLMPTAAEIDCKANRPQWAISLADNFKPVLK